MKGKKQGNSAGFQFDKRGNFGYFVGLPVIEILMQNTKELGG
jgi:hypothetical protein